MSALKTLAAIAALSIVVTACSKKEETTVEETPAVAPAPDASSMSGTAPTTVNPDPAAMPPAGEMTTTPPAPGAPMPAPQ